MNPVRKAVFPVAGLGTRFLPATKAMPKEMLPVVDRPLIQHVVDEARQAGIEHFIFVTGRNKGVIEDHFDRQFELEFALLLPDVLVQHQQGCLAQMIEAARGLPANANIVAVEEVPRDRVDQYGVVGIGERKGKMFSITSMVEKPAPDRAPSNLIITGRYILQPEILDTLSRQERGTGGEIQLTDAMIQLAQSQPFYGLQFEGRSFDCGSKIGFLAANVSYALAHADIAPGFRAEIKKILGE